MEKLRAVFVFAGSALFVTSLIEGLGGDYETALEAIAASGLSFAGAYATAQR